MFVEFDGGYDGGKCLVNPDSVEALWGHSDAEDRTKIMLASGEYVMVDHNMETVRERLAI